MRTKLDPVNEGKTNPFPFPFDFLQTNSFILTVLQIYFYVHLKKLKKSKFSEDSKNVKKSFESLNVGKSLKSQKYFICSTVTVPTKSYHKSSIM